MPPGRIAAAGTFAAFAAITPVHFAVARGTHDAHVVRVGGPRFAVVLGAESAAA